MNILINLDFSVHFHVSLFVAALVFVPNFAAIAAASSGINVE